VTTVVGTAADAESAREEALRTRPRVSLAGLASVAGDTAPGGSITRLAEISPTLVYADQETEGLARAVLRAGASGLLTLDASAEVLEQALGRVACGGLYLAPYLPADVSADSAGGTRPLSGRQREILGLIGRGQTTKTIAHELGISTKTVESHRAAIMAKLQVRTLAGLIAFAIRNGLA